MSDELADGAFVTAIDKGAKFLDKIEQLQAEAAALREALETLLRAGESSLMSDWYSAAEQARTALATDAGHEMLERLAGAERDEAWALLRPAV